MRSYLVYLKGLLCTFTWQLTIKCISTREAWYEQRTQVEQQRQQRTNKWIKTHKKFTTLFVSSLVKRVLSQHLIPQKRRVNWVISRSKRHSCCTKASFEETADELWSVGARPASAGETACPSGELCCSFVGNGFSGRFVCFPGVKGTFVLFSKPPPDSSKNRSLWLGLENNLMWVRPDRLPG